MLVKVHASTVNRLDVHTREANRSSGRLMVLVSRLIFGWTPRRPILGSEYGGEVVAVAPDVEGFATGDRVFGTTGLHFGTHAEFVTVRAAGRVAVIPAGIGYEVAAAATDGALNALSCLKAADLRPGCSILVYGASGAIGTAGVQLARHFGADVTAVTSTGNLELVRSLGVERVIDYKKEDFTRNGETYDVILDAAGKLSFPRSRGSLKPGGVFLPTDGLGNVGWAIWTSVSKRKGRRVVFQLPPRQPREDVLFLSRLLESGEYRPVIDRRYPLEEIREATRYVETQRKRGNVVLTIAG
jgi:NADPH:quinone reductase-like Zn-dependent oxidoreductase